MRNFLLLGFFLAILAPASAQTFYVAIVQGEVFYEDTKLKPRDKIKLAGSFRFSTKDDYVRVSGPTGLHTIRPQKTETGGYEFIRAVTAELFPQPMQIGSYSLSVRADLRPGEFGLLDEAYMTEGKKRALGYWADYADALFYLVKKDGEYFLLPLTIAADSLVIRAQDLSQTEASAFLVLAPDPEKFARKLRRVADEQQMQSLLDWVVYNYTDSLHYVTAWDTEPVTRRQDTLALTNYLNTGKFAKRALLLDKATNVFLEVPPGFDAEVRFHYDLSRATSPEQFLEELDYQTYLEEKYPEITHPDYLFPVLVNEALARTRVQGE